MSKLVQASINRESLLTIKELCQWLKRGRAAIYVDMKKGAFPKPIKLGGSSLWPESEVTAYIERLKAERDAGGGHV